jgi:hypothetical protein
MSVGCMKGPAIGAPMGGPIDMDTGIMGIGAMVATGSWGCKRRMPPPRALGKAPPPRLWPPRPRELRVGEPLCWEELLPPGGGVLGRNSSISIERSPPFKDACLKKVERNLTWAERHQILACSEIGFVFFLYVSPRSLGVEFIHVERLYIGPDGQPASP